VDRQLLVSRADYLNGEGSRVSHASLKRDGHRRRLERVGIRKIEVIRVSDIVTDVALNLDRRPNQVVLGERYAGDSVEGVGNLLDGAFHRRAADGSAREQDSDAVALERGAARENLLATVRIMELAPGCLLLLEMHDSGVNRQRLPPHGITVEGPEELAP
jgi:hypothetical protein